MRNLVALIGKIWYRHAKEVFYLAAGMFWGYMTLMFYIPLLLKVK